MSKTHSMGKQDINLGFMSGLQGMISFFSFDTKEADNKTMMFEGYHQMLNGLSLFLKGVEASLNEQIDLVIDNERSSLTDDVYYTAVELNKSITPLIMMMAQDDETPKKLKHQLLAVRERLSMLLILERQFRPVEYAEALTRVMPELTNVVDFQKEQEFKVGGWKEV